MTLTYILVFVIFALIIGWLVPPRRRILFFLGGSVLAIYWLQPSTPIRNLDFWFPTASIVLTGLVWAVVSKAAAGEIGSFNKSTLISGGIISGLILLVGVTRYIEPLNWLTPTRPPNILVVAVVLVAITMGIFLLYRIWPNKRFLSNLTIIVIIVLFIVLKSDDLSVAASAWLRSRTGQPVITALTTDLPWIGFSFLALRLLHVLRDYQGGRLPSYSLREFISYAIFFPTYTAGPIDRSQRFMGDLRKTTAAAGENSITLGPIKFYGNSEQLVVGSRRILWGVFKKFVLADGLALIALNGLNAAHVQSTLWMWVLLYAYALRIYFDFSGYTDIALGLGLFMGFKLPENFDRPYLKSSLTAFWNSWHITLAQWFRSYYFNPVTRGMRLRGLPAWLIIIVGQFSTMLLIGLWHGITWNFAIWGAWHGIGLFVNNRWTAWMGPRLSLLELGGFTRRVLTVSGWFVTFNYVTLGWVWFVLPDVELSWRVLQRLFGF